MIKIPREEAQKVLDALEKIIQGCNEVEKDEDTHKEGKDLARLVRIDCRAPAEILRARLSKRGWQGLTDEEMLNAYAPNRIPDSAYSNMGEDLKKIHDATKEEMLSGLRAIEAKLREKNSGR
jgi:hypothetical protein